MTEKATFEILPIEDIDFDFDNPRVNDMFERLKDPDVEHYRIELADRSSKYRALQQSILAHGFIFNPIILQKLESGRYKCIEGNTRLNFYNEFSESDDQKIRDKNQYAWKQIPAFVYPTGSEEENKIFHEIRLQAHLVGPRPWKAVNKARYIYNLRKQDILSWDEIKEKVGGSLKDLQSSYKAYEVYENNFKPLYDEPWMAEKNKFSGIKEFIKPTVESAVRKEFPDTYNDEFCRWLKEGEKIGKLSNVRKLGQIFANDDTKAKFLSDGGNVETAMRIIEAGAAPQTIEKASIEQLCDELSERLDKIDPDDIAMWGEDEEDPTLMAISMLKAKLDSTLYRAEIEESD